MSGKILTPDQARRQAAAQQVMERARKGYSLTGLQAQALFVQLQLAHAHIERLKKASKQALEAYQARVSEEVDGLRELVAYGQQAVQHQADMLERLVVAYEDASTKDPVFDQDLIDEVRRYLAPRPEEPAEELEQEPAGGSPAGG